MSAVIHPDSGNTGEPDGAGRGEPAGASPAAALTPTSYAVLGLLAIREWTTYELANQTQRSYGYFWARARRRIYDEPRRLAAAGYATVRKETVGRRPRQCWRITPAGRQALGRWLEEPATDVPVLEFEGMLKVFTAENGNKQALLDTLAGIGAAARERRAVLETLCDELARTGGPFPDRIHTNALAMSYMLAVNDATLAWAAESEQTVRQWRSPARPGAAARARAGAFFRRHARSAADGSRAAETAADD